MNDPGAGGPEQQEPTARIREALSLARVGRLDEAASLCREVVAEIPRHFEALALLGTLAENRGRYQEAIEWLTRAVEVRPRAADVIAARATVLRSLGRDEEAVEAFDQALTIRPDLVAAIFNKGNALLSLGRYNAALQAFERVLDIAPDDDGAMTHRGIALLELGRTQEALASHDRALATRPDSIEALVNRSNCLRALGRADEAWDTLRRALELAPGHVDALVAAATASAASGRHDATIDYCDRALATRPRHADALRLKAGALQALNRYPEALPVSKAACAARADSAAMIGLGNALQTLGRYEEALAAAERALELDSESAEAENNRGNALRALRRYDEALESFARVIARQPRDVSAHWNEGLTRLTLGDYERGWKGFAWRTHGLSDGTDLLQANVPEWTGEPLDGKSLVLYAEQGFGDALQFVRYAPLLMERGAVDITVVCGEPLRRLVGTVRGVSRVLTPDEPPPAADYQALLPSLPGVFGTRVDAIPAETPYLNVDAERVARWQARVAAAAGRHKIGLVWRSNPENPAAWTRDCPAETLQPLFELADTTFFSLQPEAFSDDVADLVARHGIVDLADGLTDFLETAAAIVALDRVVTVDTAVAHLTGALGCPGHVMLRYSADWRWLLDRDDSPWYPSLRLHRQTRVGDWDAVVRDVVEALQEIDP